jgi:hypothetical protein
MKKLNQTLSDVLDIEPITVDDTKDNLPSTEVVELTSKIDDDADFARTNLRSLIEKGNTAMDELLTVAKASEHPRAYEVAAGLIKNLADLNKDLLEIQKRKRDLLPKDKQDNGGNVHVDKAVFVGSTAELVRLLKNTK